MTVCGEAVFKPHLALSGMSHQSATTSIFSYVHWYLCELMQAALAE
jgi:hypothetical protein